MIRAMGSDQVNTWRFDDKTEFDKPTETSKESSRSTNRNQCNPNGSGGSFQD